MDSESTFLRRLHGFTIFELWRQRHIYGGTPSDEANVIFARVGDRRWLRFFFDGGVFFWREVATPDSPPPEGEHRWLLAEVPVAGSRQVVSVEFDGAEGTAERVLVIEFQGGGRVELRNRHDVNTLLASGA